MAAFGLLVLVLGLVAGSDATWCVCRSDQSNPALQKTLDYACGAGADCNPILQSGPGACYNPNTVVSHCSYAANSYFQRKGQAQGSCDFSGTATVTTTDPSGGGCTYPSTPSAAGTSGTPSTTTPGSSTTPTTPGSTFTPGTGAGTGTGTIGGLGPAGSANYDGSAAGLPPRVKMGSLLLTILIPTLLYLGFD